VNPPTVLVAGSANADFAVRAPRIPGRGETVLGRDFATHPGGKGANQAVASARAGGVRTRMLVALGDDSSAALLEASLREAGVEPDIVRVPDQPTGVALICSADDAENAIVVAPGANAALRPQHLPSLQHVSALLMQLETPLATVEAFAHAARAAGVPVLLNAAPAMPLPASLLPAIDVLIVNEEELAGVSPTATTVADRLRALSIPTVVVTLGRRGCCAYARGEFILQPAFEVKAIDTTAAGDTFCGVLAAELARSEGLESALTRASAAAALATTRLGAQPSIPLRENVETLSRAASSAASADRASRLTLARYCGLPA
jgi:ribokinase